MRSPFRTVPGSSKNCLNCLRKYFPPEYPLSPFLYPKTAGRMRSPFRTVPGNSKHCLMKSEKPDNSNFVYHQFPTIYLPTAHIIPLGWHNNPAKSKNHRNAKSPQILNHNLLIGKNDKIFLNIPEYHL